MNRSDSSVIIKAIKAALIEDNPDVKYVGPSRNGRCGFFKVATHGNLSLDEIDVLLDPVKKEYEEYDLQRDPHFDGTFDLNAYGDKK